MIAEIDGYWESRIDRMMAQLPSSMTGELNLFMSRDIFEMMGEPDVYNNIKVVSFRIGEEEMYICPRSYLYTDLFLN